MSLELESENKLLEAIQAASLALTAVEEAVLAVKDIPRPKEVQRILKTAREYAEVAGVYWD